MSLSELLNPRSVAVVGASPRPQAAANRLVANLDRLRFAGPVHLVTPRHGSIDGVPCLPHVGALPEPVDVAVLAVPAAEVLTQIEALAAAGVNNAVVYSAGFAELDDAGADLQAHLVERARALDVTVMGPNCMGNLNLVDGVCTTFSSMLVDQPVRPGSVACVSQSGGVGVAIYSMGVQSGLGFSHVVSTGNEAVVSAADVLATLVDDQATEVVLVYAERLADGRRFLAAAHDLMDRGCPVIVLQSGRTEAGATAVQSHTGAMATPWAVTRDVFAEAGILTVSTPQEMLAAAQLAVSHRPLPAGRRVTVLASSGGTAVLAADLGAEAGLELPALDEVTVKELRGLLPDFAPIGNPLDVTANLFHDADAAGRLLDAVGRADTDALAVVSILATDSSLGLAESLAPLLAASSRPSMAVWVGGDERTRAPFVERGIPYDDDLERLLGCFSRLVEAGGRRGVAVRPADGPASGSGRQATEWVTEADAKAQLAAAGLSVPRSSIARSPAEAVAWAASVGGAVVMKVLDPAVPHRAQVGAIALGLRGNAEVGAAFERIRAAAAAAGAEPDAPVLVEAMVAAGGAEYFVGYERDTAAGPVLAFGLGGGLAEQLHQVVFALAPLAEPAGEWLLDRSPAWSALAPSDRAALASFLVRVSTLCSADPDLVSMDLNPVVLADGGPVILDALAQVTANVRQTSR